MIHFTVLNPPFESIFCRELACLFHSCLSSWASVAKDLYLCGTSQIATGSKLVVPWSPINARSHNSMIHFVFFRLHCCA